MTILIKNTQLLDGTGRPAVKADILIKKEKIYAVGSFPRYKANEVIDAMGAYCSPGFIDINTDSDHYLTLFSNPSQRDFALQGVTTIVGGQCGASLAPLLYGSLDSIKKWADIGKINVNWHTVNEFFQTMKKFPLGVNFGTFVGHTTIKQDLTNNETSRDLSKNELRIYNLILERALKDGAFGISFGLGYAENQKTSYSEIKALAETATKHKGLCAVHLRNEKRGLLASVNEIIDIAKETGAKILISHFRPLIGYLKDYQEALELINKNSDKADIYFDIYPFDVSTILAHAFLPEWLQKEEERTILKDIETPGLREKILKELPRLKGEEIVIINAPKHEYLVGKSLKEFSQNRNLNIAEGLLELMKLTDFRAVVFYKNISLKKTVQALTHERAIIASNSACFKEEKVIKPERSCKTFAKFLELTEKEKILPLEKAIHKITGLPAQRLGLKDRGLIRDNYFADLVIFKDAEIREVILNGKRAVKEGQFQNILAGRVLKHEI
jgi:N-acyl-D-amino-acid deacylase